MSYVHQLPSGRWRTIVKHAGRQRTGTADTRTEAVKLGAKLLVAMSADDQGSTRRRPPATVADIIGRYLADNDEHWSPGYLADVEAVADRIPERFTKRRAATIGALDVADLYRQLAAGGWTPHRLRRLHELLSAAWRHCEKFEMVDRNPIKPVSKPRARRHELAIPSDDEVTALLAAVDGAERLALRVAATLGIRRGEIVALQWRDVDLDAANVAIRRALRYAPAAGVVEGRTKTGDRAHRVLALEDRTATEWRKWWRHVEPLAAEAGVVPRWVFSDDAGVTPWRPDRLTHIFAKARKAAGVDRVRLHDLRHYVATTMLQDGEPLSDVAGQLGHTSEQTTATVYAHYLPGRGRESVQRRGARIG